MSITLLYEEQPPQQAGAKADGENLWFTLEQLHGTTGWELKSRGVCLGDVCVPISAGRESEFLRADDTEFNLAALARSQGQPVVRHGGHAAWFFGKPEGLRCDALTSLQAPDFTLPDLDGKSHSLSDYTGKKSCYSHGPRGEAVVLTCQSGRVFAKYSKPRIL